MSGNQPSALLTFCSDDRMHYGLFLFENSEAGGLETQSTSYLRASENRHSDNSSNRSPHLGYLEFNVVTWIIFKHM
jgi:hypothetical protein